LKKSENRNRKRMLRVNKGRTLKRKMNLKQKKKGIEFRNRMKWKVGKKGSVTTGHSTSLTQVTRMDKRCDAGHKLLAHQQ